MYKEICHERYFAKCALSDAALTEKKQTPLTVSCLKSDAPKTLKTHVCDLDPLTISHPKTVATPFPTRLKNEQGIHIYALFRCVFYSAEFQCGGEVQPTLYQCNKNSFYCIGHFLDLGFRKPLNTQTHSELIPSFYRAHLELRQTICM